MKYLIQVLDEVHCSMTENYSHHTNAYFLTLRSLCLLSAGLLSLEPQGAWIVGKTQIPKSSFLSLLCQIRKHCRVIFTYKVFRTHCLSRGLSIGLLRLSSFSSCPSPSHQSRQKEWGEGICPFPCLACCCIRKQHIYLAFC